MKKIIIENKKRIIILLLVLIFQASAYCITKLFHSNLIYLNNYFDNMIPFISYFVIFYITWYPLLFLIPLLILKYDKKVFDRYVISVFIFAIFECIMFILLPTTMNREAVNVTNISTFIVNVIYKFDTPTNLFPSAHCGFAILFIISIFDIKKLKKKYKILVLIMSLLIVLSTLFIKQHVFIDVLGSLIIIPIYYILRKEKINIEKSGIYAKIFCQK